jgi:SAM-dependent methyltransferase
VSDVSVKRRLGQGNAVDRNRPHWFHRDYWPLYWIRQAVRDFLREQGREFQNGCVVDFGAGESPYSADFQRLNSRLILADINPTDPNCLAISSDGRVPLDEGSVDAVLSTQVLEHVADPQAYLSEAHRLLRANGLLLLTTHGAFILHRVPTDYRRWTVDGLTLELESAGFEVCSLRCRITMLAMATHLRSIAIGGLLRRIPVLGLIRPMVYLWFNVQMALEQWLTPHSIADAHPELLVVVARKKELKPLENPR